MGVNHIKISAIADVMQRNDGIFDGVNHIKISAIADRIRQTPRSSYGVNHIKISVTEVTVLPLNKD